MRSYGRSAGIVAASLALALVSASVHAEQAGAQAQRQQAAPRQGAAAPNRLVLERQVRVRLQRVMRESLSLTDDQLTRLESAMLTFEGRRRELLREERQLRQALRDAIGGSPRAPARTDVDEAMLASRLDSLVSLQRRRIELIEQEQRELATFLTPLQRVQYFALQENLRRMLEQRRNGAGQPGRPAARRPDPGQAVPPS